MRTIVREYRPCQVPRVKDPPTGLDGMLDGVIGCYKRRKGILSELRKDAEAIDQRDEDWKFLSDPALQKHLKEFRAIFRRASKNADDSLLDALAAIREAAQRVTNLRPFTVQLMGALALNRGYLAEMATGEGKTLTAAMAGILAGWTGKPCHIVTVNDYLAKRDAEWFRKLYEFCGVSVGSVTSSMAPEDRARGYAADVTYTTSKEVAADFLRDRLKLGEINHPTQRLLKRHLQPYRADDGLVMRGLHTAIIDEADSVLIDEAATPLIISSATNNNTLHQVYKVVWKIANSLKKDEHYKVDLRYKEITLIGPGKLYVESMAHLLPDRWRGASRPVELVEQALNAREFFKRGKQYVVKKDKVVIVDEFTGRLMEMRKWRHGLHQAIEAKEGVPLSPVDQTLARLSFQRYFRLYSKLSGMTGTAKEASGELWHTYHLPVVRIPPNRPLMRKDYGDRLFATMDEKIDAIIKEVKVCHETGRPVLLGTRNVVTSQILAERLNSEGLVVDLLNALNDDREARIIAEAGQSGSITIATNMAGRGTDIKLGKGVVELGGLHVIAAERNEARRIDRQLFGRTGRQGNPGSAVAYVSCEDELLPRFAPKWLLGIFYWSLKFKIPGAALIGKFTNWRVQKKAQHLAFYARKSVMKMDTWLDEAVSFSGKSTV